MIEILLGLALGLVIIAALGQLYAGSKKSYVLSDAMTRLNENGRFAVDFLANDLRMAGYLSCGGSAISIARNALVSSLGNSINAPGDWRYQTGGIEGFEGGIDTPPTQFSDQGRPLTEQSKPGTDILVIRRTTMDLEYGVIQNNSTSRIVRLDLGHQFQTGEILVISDPSCTQTSIFQVTRVLNLYHLNQTTRFDAIEYGVTNGLTPGNCSGMLFGSFDCASVANANCTCNTTARSKAFPTGSIVSRYAVYAYYLSRSDPPALTRKRLSQVNGQATLVTEELIRDVEDFQVLYGLDTISDANHRVDVYVKADQVTNWDLVVSVRFALLMRSHEANVRPQATAVSYDMMGIPTPQAADRRLRRSFGSVVAIRNNLP